MSESVFLHSFHDVHREGKKGTTFKERSDKCYNVVPVFFFFDC